MCTPMPPSAVGSLPTRDPCGKAGGPMRPGVYLLSAAAGIAIGRGLRRPFPTLDDNPFVGLVYVYEPGIHTAIHIWYYAAPAVTVLLVGSVLISIWRVWFPPRPRRRRGKLPRWPASPADPAPSLVVGELHHPTTPRESDKPD